mgnify:CR=1 FL=1
MNKIYMVLILAILLIGGFYILMRNGTPVAIVPETETAQSQSYSNPTYGIAFEYPLTYVLSERDIGGTGERLHHVITLMRKADLPAPENGEGPPSITFEMFQNNLDNLTTEGWIRGSSKSNFKLSSEGVLASTTIDSKPALSYRWSGLYEGTTIALAQANWIYAFSVTYLEPGADIVQDFVAIRDSVRIDSSQTP